MITLACKQQTISLHIWWILAEHIALKMSPSLEQCVCFKTTSSCQRVFCQKVSQYFSCYCTTTLLGCNRLFSAPYRDWFPFGLTLNNFWTPSIQGFIYFTYITGTWEGSNNWIHLTLNAVCKKSLRVNLLGPDLGFKKHCAIMCCLPYGYICFSLQVLLCFYLPLPIKHNYSTDLSNSKLGTRSTPSKCLIKLHSCTKCILIACLCPLLHEINKLSHYVSELAKMLALSYDIRHPSRYHWLTLSIPHNLSLCPF